MKEFIPYVVDMMQEIRLGDSEVIRALFERVTCLSLPPRKIEV